MKIDPEDHKKIIKSIRKAWYYSKVRREVLKAALVGKDEAGEKIYRCAGGCKKPTSRPYVDHINPMEPTTEFDSYAALIERTFDRSNQQILCKLHHDPKSKKENALRRKRNG